MTDETKVIDAELVVGKATDTALAIPGLPRGFEWMAKLDSVNWRDLKPYQMALVLSTKRFTVSGGGTVSLNLTDALAIAMRCYALGLDPNSTEVWIDTDKKAANPTTEGLVKLAKNADIDYEIVGYEFTERAWPERVPKLPNVAKDRGCTCTLEIKGRTHKLAYTAWLSEWGVRWAKEKQAQSTWQSPQWEQRTDHMLRMRSLNHALEDLLAVGMSGMPAEEQLEGGE